MFNVNNIVICSVALFMHFDAVLEVVRYLEYLGCIL